MSGAIQGKGTLFRNIQIQVDDIILPWVADGVPPYWWVPMYVLIRLPSSGSNEGMQTGLSKVGKKRLSLPLIFITIKRFFRKYWVTFFKTFFEF